MLKNSSNLNITVLVLCLQKKPFCILIPKSLDNQLFFIVNNSKISRYHPRFMNNNADR